MKYLLFILPILLSSCSTTFHKDPSGSLCVETADGLNCEDNGVIFEYSCDQYNEDCSEE